MPSAKCQFDADSLSEADQEDLAEAAVLPEGFGEGESIIYTPGDNIERESPPSGVTGFKLSQSIMRRLDLPVGTYSPRSDTLGPAYAGGPMRLVTRAAVDFKFGLQTSLTFDKDPGEAFRWSPGTKYFGFDFVGFSASLQRRGILRSVVVGDYWVELGSGLLLWKNMSTGKGGQLFNRISRFGSGVRPSRSTEENRFFRGAAVTIAGPPNVLTSIFFSRRSLDASTTFVDGEGSDSLVVNTLSSGLHRTTSELENRDRLLEELSGASLEFENDKLTAGVAGYAVRFDKSFAPELRPNAAFDFSGNHFRAASFYVGLGQRRQRLFSELMIDGNGTVGGIVSAIASPNERTQIALSARRYPPQLNSLFGNGFSEASGSPGNETGIYFAARFQPSPRFTVKYYIDHFTFPWERTTSGFRSRGHESMVLFVLQPRRWTRMELRHRSELKTGVQPYSDFRLSELKAEEQRFRSSSRLTVSHDFSKVLHLQSRVELSRSRSGSSRAFGGLAFQRVRIQLNRSFTVDARIALYDVGDHDARIYAYERGLTGSFSVPSYSGTGTRWYVFAQATPLQAVRIQIKYSKINKKRTSVNSFEDPGYERNREVGAQIQIRI